MRIICPISGEEYTLPGFSQANITTQHPIFSWNVEKLTDRRLVAAWARGQLDTQESRLLFLALLNSTGAVTWHTIADPSVSVVNQNMEKLFKLVSWMNAVDPGTIQFPAFRVTEINYQLTNISVFINQWYECKNNHLAGGSNRLQLQELLEARENRLAKLIQDAVPVEELAGRLASWALDATGVKDSGRRKLWTEYFKLDDPAIWSVDKASFLEMKTYMDVNLFLSGTHAAGAGGSFALQVVKLLGRLWQRIEDGPLAELSGGETYSFIDTDGTTKTRDTVETINKRIITANAPTSEPIKSQYPTLVTYLRARAAWQVAQAYKQSQVDSLEQAGL